MNTVSLTFRGPHLFVVPPPKDGVSSPSVLIYAPKCAGHTGSVYWGESELHLFGRARMGGKFPYVLTGPVANSGKISYQWNTALPIPNPILSPEPWDGSTSFATDPDLLNSAYYSIQAPRPRIFYALNTVDDTEVVTAGDCANNFGHWATGFRLYYDLEPGASIHLSAPSVPAGATGSSTPVVLSMGKRATDPSDWLPLPTVADIQFQYERGGGDDLEHRDAMDCFEQLTKLVGLDWWVNFKSEPVGRGGSAIHSGGDCMAIPIAVGINH